MKYYLAPLEGITTYIYRRAYHTYFHPMDKYFIPFLSPHMKKGFTTKEFIKKELDNHEVFEIKLKEKIPSRSISIAISHNHLPNFSVKKIYRDSHK